MANKFLNGIDTTSLSVNSQYSLPTSDGSNKQVLQTDGNGNVTFSDIDLAGAQAHYVYYEVKNSTGSTIPKGTGVMAVGTDGNSGHILVSPMVADGSVEPKYFMGVTSDAIGNGQTGEVIHFGMLTGFDTSGFNDGDILYCDASNNGGFTATEPTAPDLKLAIAFVVSAANNGKIFIRVQGNEGLHELHDVNISSQTDGELLIWDNTDGVWKNDSTVIIDNPNTNLKINSNGSAKLTLRGDLNNIGDTGQVDNLIDFLHDADTHGYRLNTENYSGKTAFHFQEKRNDSFLSRVYIDGDGVVTVKNDFLIDDGVGRITIDSITDTNRILSTTTGFAEYEDLEFRADAYTFKLGTSEILNISNSGTSKFSGLLRLEHDFASGVAIALDRTSNALVNTVFNIGVSSAGSIATDFMWLGTATTDVAINGSGYLGLGITNPQSKIHLVQDSSNNQLLLERTGTATGKFKIYTNNDSLFFNNEANATIPIKINSSDDVSFTGHIAIAEDIQETYQPDWHILHFKDRFDIAGRADSTSHLLYNLHWNGTNWVHVKDGYASKIDFEAGGGINIDLTDDGLDGDTASFSTINIDKNANITATSFIKDGGASSQFLKADGSVDSNTYLTSYSESDTLDSVTDRGNTTTNSISVGKTGSPSQALDVEGNIIVGGQANGFIHNGKNFALSADGSMLLVVDSNDTSGDTPDGQIIFGGGSAVDTNADQSFTFSEAYPSNLPRNEWARFKEGKLGIGDDNPQNYLSIKNTAGDADILLQGSGPQTMRIDQNSIRTSTNTSITIFTNSDTSQSVNINSNGSVGVGTTTPSASSKLHVYKETQIGTLLTLENVTDDIGNDDGTGNFIDFVSTDTNANFYPQARIGMVVKDYSGDGGIPSEGCGNFVVYTGVGTDAVGGGSLTESLRVRETTDVDVVAGSLLMGGTETIDNNRKFYALDTASNSAPAYTFDGDTNTGLSRIATDSVGLIAGGSRKFYVSPTEAYFQNLSNGVSFNTSEVNIESTGSVALNIKADTDNATSENEVPCVQFTQDGGQGILKIGGNGDTGSLYTDALSNAAYVMGGVGHNGTVPLQLGVNNTAYMTMLSTGLTGLHTNNPTGTLHIFGLGDLSWDRHITLEYETGDIGKIVVDTDGFKFRNFTAGNGYYFRNVDNVTALNIQSSGDVGIGIANATPSARLHVLGTTRFDGFSTADPDSVSIANYGGVHTFTYYDQSVGVSVIGGQGDHTGTNLLLGQETGASANYNYLSCVADTNGTPVQEFELSGGGKFYARASASIGTTSSNVALTVKGNAQTFEMRGTDHTYMALFRDNNSRSGYFGYGSGASDRMTIKNETGGDIAIVENNGAGIFIKGGGGAVGIGENNPQHLLHLKSVSGINLMLEADSDNVTETDNANILFSQDGGLVTSRVGFGSGTNNLQIVQEYAGYVQFGTSGNIRMSIDANGAVGIMDETPSYALDVNGTIRATGDVIAYSDQRVKENISTINNALDKVSQMRGVSFNKIGEDKKSVGVIAQEIEKILPEVVHEDEKGMKSVAYGNVVGVLIEAIKEQQKQIDELKAIVYGDA